MTSPTEIGDLISSAQRQIRRGVREANPAIPPHAQRALRTISREPVRPARLAQTLSITPRAVTSVLDALAATDLITITDDPTDRRAKIATITPAGTAALAQADATRARIMEDLTTRLNEGEMDTLATLLRKLTASPATEQ